MSTDETGTELSKDNPRRKWMRFSLFTLMVMVLVVSLLCGWIGLGLRRAEANRRAKAELAEQAHQIAVLGAVPLTRTVQKPDAIRKLLGDPGKEEIYHVDAFCSPSMNDVNLAKLAPLLANVSTLERLDLRNTSVSDEGLSHIGQLTQLKTLYLGYEKGPWGGKNRSQNITDAGLAHLTGLTNLKVLFVENTGATSEGIKKLENELVGCTITTDP